MIEAIERGLKGDNQPLYNGLDRSNELLLGTLRGKYYLIGAESSVGKTSFADYSFLISPYMRSLEVELPYNIKYFYYSFELSKEVKYINWLCAIIYLKEGVVIDPNKAMGYLYPEVLNERELFLVKKYEPLVNTLFANMTFNTSSNPTGMLFEIREWLANNGKEITEEFIDEQGNKKHKVIEYIPNDPKQMVIVIVDHLALMTIESNNTLKQNMDLMSKYLIKLRNIYNITPVVIQQFNTGLTSVHRQATMRNMENQITPQRADFGDSTYTYQDSDFVIAGVSPYRYDLNTYKGYRILGNNALRNKATFWCVIKNRPLGREGIIPLYRNTSFPLFTELPRIGTPELDLLYREL